MGNVRARPAQDPAWPRHSRNDCSAKRRRVLVDQAEPVCSLNSDHAGELPKGRVGDWDLKVEPALAHVQSPAVTLGASGVISSAFAEVQS